MARAKKRTSREAEPTSTVDVGQPAAPEMQPQTTEPVEPLPDDSTPEPEADETADTAARSGSAPEPVKRPAKRAKRAAPSALEPLRAGGHIDRRDGRGWVLDTKEK